MNQQKIAFFCSIKGTYLLFIKKYKKSPFFADCFKCLDLDPFSEIPERKKLCFLPIGTWYTHTRVPVPLTPSVGIAGTSPFLLSTAQSYNSRSSSKFLRGCVQHIDKQSRCPAAAVLDATDCHTISDADPDELLYGSGSWIRNFATRIQIRIQDSDPRKKLFSPNSSYQNFVKNCASYRYAALFEIS